jgi:hypothetical protein
MFCKKCGSQLREGARFCASCGNAVTSPADEPVIPEQQPVEQAYGQSAFDQQPPFAQTYEQRLQPPQPQGFGEPAQPGFDTQPTQALDSLQPQVFGTPPAQDFNVPPQQEFGGFAQPTPAEQAFDQLVQQQGAQGYNQQQGDQAWGQQPQPSTPYGQTYEWASQAPSFQPSQPNEPYQQPYHQPAQPSESQTMHFGGFPAPAQVAPPTQATIATRSSGGRKKKPVIIAAIIIAVVLIIGSAGVTIALNFDKLFPGLDSTPIGGQESLPAQERIQTNTTVVDRGSQDAVKSALAIDQNQKTDGLQAGVVHFSESNYMVINSIADKTISISRISDADGSKAQTSLEYSHSGSGSAEIFVYQGKLLLLGLDVTSDGQATISLSQLSNNGTSQEQQILQNNSFSVTSVSGIDSSEVTVVDSANNFIYALLGFQNSSSAQYEYRMVAIDTSTLQITQYQIFGEAQESRINPICVAGNRLFYFECTPQQTGQRETVILASQELFSDGTRGTITEHSTDLTLSDSFSGRRGSSFLLIAGNGNKDFDIYLFDTNKATLCLLIGTNVVDAQQLPSIVVTDTNIFYTDVKSKYDGDVKKLDSGSLGSLTPDGRNTVAQYSIDTGETKELGDSSYDWSIHLLMANDMQLYYWMGSAADIYRFDWKKSVADSESLKI